MLREVARLGSTSRTHLTEATGLTGTAITRITRELVELGLLRETQKEPLRESRPGRPRTLLELRADGAHVLAVGIHMLDRSVILANLRGDVVARAEIPANILHDPERTMRRVHDLCTGLVERARSHGGHVLGIGVSVAGVVDARRNLIREIPQLRWRNVPVELGPRIDLPVLLDNVNNTLNLAELRFGITGGLQDVLLVRVATYVGGSLIVHGRIAHGASRGAGQIGHMATESGARTCVCGRRGCLNTTASGLAVLCEAGGIDWDEALELDIETSSRRIGDVMTRARHGDRSARTALVRAGSRLGSAVHSLAMVLDPEAIVLGGPLANDPWYRHGVERCLYDDPARTPVACRTLEVSRMDMVQATIATALDAFVFSPALDVGRLPGRRASRAGEAASRQVL